MIISFLLGFHLLFIGHHPHPHPVQIGTAIVCQHDMQGNVVCTES